LPRESTTLIHAGLDVGHCYARLFFADIRKGFDLVDHNFIIGELRNLQVHPAIIRWIKSFLTGRKQSVKLATASSSWKKVNGDLPQCNVVYFIYLMYKLHLSLLYNSTLLSPCSTFIRRSMCSHAWVTWYPYTQGTKLGPILFAILTNSLLKDWQGRVKFVDDTTLLEIVPRC
jgi:hypothetical protein